MGRNPLHTKLCDMLGIDFPIIAFTHCKDVVAAVVNAGGFAVLGEAMHTADDIAADIKWIRSRVGDKPFGIDLVLPASAPDADDLATLVGPGLTIEAMGKAAGTIGYEVLTRLGPRFVRRYIGGAA